MSYLAVTGMIGFFPQVNIFDSFNSAHGKNHSTFIISSHIQGIASRTWMVNAFVNLKGISNKCIFYLLFPYTLTALCRTRIENEQRSPLRYFI